MAGTERETLWVILGGAGAFNSTTVMIHVLGKPVVSMVVTMFVLVWICTIGLIIANINNGTVNGGDGR